MSAPMSKKESSDQRVLGIALVVEVVGKFSKLAFRYPPSPIHDTPNTTKQEEAASSDKKEQDDKYQNIFFQLPPKVMAKLFRVKPALCNQPSTLTIGGTIFCCRSVTLNVNQTSDSSSSASNHNNSNTTVDENASVQSKISQGSGSQNKGETQSIDQLVMFSIIVALLPTKVKQNSFPDASPETLSLFTHTSHEEHTESIEKEFRSQNFPVVQRIHLSLFRLCAALKREENRCFYMSRQVSMLLEIGQQAIQSENEKKESLNELEIVELMITAEPPKSIAFDRSSLDDSCKRLTRKYAIPLYGNLASELADVYFALARNDLAFRSSPASLLTGREGIVYVNLHIAVSIEAAIKHEISKADLSTEDMVDSDFIKGIRPYHTVLFPNVSAKELLLNTSASASTADGDLSQRILQKLLLVSDPFKSLYDISLETALPLSTIIEAASSLIESGACIAVPVIQSSTRFACQRGAMKLMASLKLEFAQQFSPLCPIFVVVAALTCRKGGSGGQASSNEKNLYVSFGDVIRYSRRAFATFQVEDDDNVGKKETENNKGMRSEQDREIPNEFMVLIERLISILTIGGDETDDEEDTEVVVDVEFQEIEAIIISMTTWLRSHHIIVELKNYFVSIDPFNSNFTKKSREVLKDSEKDSHPTRSAVNRDLDQMLNECHEKNYLDGSISTSALAWKLGITSLRMEGLRDYGVREKKIQVLTRIPLENDDWGAP
ncbi:hypothetical protein CTEN210_00713 [Chaetoceros tenuissimus]|uniref:Uncharacterized protein n=1 Tax=Chaetoceros tenuissimus TaxID=426638 RepID=A0AAD3GZE1_9STRA|nr:hypothetical protein CTEN210_00713 [Chaetoceros tenuissimus]